MKRSSRKRLTERSLDQYPKETLFDKIARATCLAGCLPRKELFEAWEVARQTRRRFRGGRIIDMACGHGLLGQIMLLLDNTSSGVVAVDKTLPPSCHKLHTALIHVWPRLENRINFIQTDLAEIDLNENDIVVSAHACGSLSDIIIDRAVQAGARLALLPCCHDIKTCDTGNLEGWIDCSLAIDATRVARLRQHGYSVMTKLIPDDITPKNRLILAEPI
jgi:N-acetylmuramic acid 6-phosphate (MurNAc-6-P) etherase